MKRWSLHTHIKKCALWSINKNSEVVEQKNILINKIAIKTTATEKTKMATIILLQFKKTKPKKCETQLGQIIMHYSKMSS